MESQDLIIQEGKMQVLPIQTLSAILKTKESLIRCTEAESPPYFQKERDRQTERERERLENKPESSGKGQQTGTFLLRSCF